MKNKKLYKELFKDENLLKNKNFRNNQNYITSRNSYKFIYLYLYNNHRNEYLYYNLWDLFSLSSGKNSFKVTYFIRSKSNIIVDKNKNYWSKNYILAFISLYIYWLYVNYDYDTFIFESILYWIILCFIIIVLITEEKNICNNLWKKVLIYSDKNRYICIMNSKMFYIKNYAKNDKKKSIEKTTVNKENLLFE